MKPFLLLPPSIRDASGSKKKNKLAIRWKWVGWSSFWVDPKGNWNLLLQCWLCQFQCFILTEKNQKVSFSLDLLFCGRLGHLQLLTRSTGHHDLLKTFRGKYHAKNYVHNKLWSWCHWPAHPTQRLLGLMDLDGRFISVRIKSEMFDQLIAFLMHNLFSFLYDQQNVLFSGRIKSEMLLYVVLVCLLLWTFVSHM